MADVAPMTTLMAQSLLCQRKMQTPLTLHCHPGECWVILGQNGSGKTTLLHTLMGLLPPVQGSVKLDQHPLKTYTRQQRALTLGLLSQDTHTPFPLTVKAYCQDARYPHGKESKATTAALTQAALSRFALTHLKDKKLTECSGGERRLVAHAALLVQAPVFYLLDEPSNQLDIKHQLAVLTHYHSLSLSGKHGVIMSLHDIHLAQRFATHVLMLFNDGTHRHGSAASLLTKSQLSALYDCDLPHFQTKGETHGN